MRFGCTLALSLLGTVPVLGVAIRDVSKRGENGVDACAAQSSDSGPSGKNITKVVIVDPVYINTFVQQNTILTVYSNIFVTVNNAPTKIVINTWVTSTATVTATPTPTPTPGPDGPQGSPGPHGPPHYPSPDGEDGKDGKDGNDGEEGHDGQDGHDGKDGQDGKDGKDGNDNNDGHDDNNGHDGQDGNDGHDGAPGPRGPPGPPGWQYKGCGEHDFHDHHSADSPATCAAICGDTQFYGWSKSRNCGCGHDEDALIALFPVDECGDDMPVQYYSIYRKD